MIISSLRGSPSFEQFTSNGKLRQFVTITLDGIVVPGRCDPARRGSHHADQFWPHQNCSQADDRLRGALQNVGLEVIFRAGRQDADTRPGCWAGSTRWPVKHEVPDEDASQHTHPTYFPLQKQWEKQLQAIQYLPTGHAFVQMPTVAVYKVHIRRLPELPAALPGLAAVQARYLQYFTPVPGTSPTAGASPPRIADAPPPPAISRRSSPRPPVASRPRTPHTLFFHHPARRLRAVGTAQALAALAPSKTHRLAHLPRISAGRRRPGALRSSGARIKPGSHCL